LINSKLDKKIIFTPRGSIYFIGLIFGFMMFLSLPKIYLSNNIYYISKDINTLYAHYMSLKEENKFLVQQLEDAKFKNQITDSLIMQNLEDQPKEEQ
jgi:regulator of replication initiation timing